MNSPEHQSLPPTIDHLRRPIEGVSLIKRRHTNINRLFHDLSKIFQSINDLSIVICRWLKEDVPTSTRLNINF